MTRYWRKIWPYFLIIVCGANVIIILYTGQLLHRIATTVFHVIVMLVAREMILQERSKDGSTISDESR